MKIYNRTSLLVITKMLQRYYKNLNYANFYNKISSKVLIFSLLYGR